MHARTAPHRTIPYEPTDFCLSRCSIFRRAASTISSLRRFSASALSFLLADQPADLLPLLLPVVIASSCSPSLVALSFDVKLYRVIKSGFTDLAPDAAAAAAAAVVRVAIGTAVCGIGGWNDGGGCVNTHQHGALDDTVKQCIVIMRTDSRLLPLRIRSVVASTLPPFLCKSHMMLRLGSCGNICATCSTCAGLTWLLALPLLDCPAGDDGPANHRKTR